MDTFKVEVNKIILGLTSVGLVLLMLPVSLSAHHYRSGPISDNGTHITIRLKIQNGWSANHGHFRSSTDYSNSYSGTSVKWGSGVWVSGYIGSIKDDYYETDWGNGTDNTTMDHKILSSDNVTTRTHPFNKFPLSTFC